MPKKTSTSSSNSSAKLTPNSGSGNPLPALIVAGGKQGPPPATQWFVDQLNSYLGQHDLKQTKQRQIVVECFLRLNTHVDAEELHRVLNAEGHSIGLATIYRTLNLLKEAELVEQKSFADGRSIFEINQPDSHHDHLICDQCGAVFEFENSEIEVLQKSIAKTHHFELRDHRLDLFGKCLIEKCTRGRRKS